MNAVATDADEGSSSSSSPTPSRAQNHHSCGSLANRAEYYTRKRENFIIAWEVQLERQGESYFLCRTVLYCSVANQEVPPAMIPDS